MTPQEVVEHVCSLPLPIIVELARGPAEDPWDCHACRVLDPQRRQSNPAALALSDWHAELVHHVPGRGSEQDATRAGMIYGAAAAVASSREDGRHDS